jgi:short-subunit dehydrogenase
MLVKAGLDKKFKARHPGLMSAERCAELALGAFVSRKRFYVPGLLNKANLLAARVLPRRFVLRMAEKLYRPSS